MTAVPPSVLSSVLCSDMQVSRLVSSLYATEEVTSNLTNTSQLTVDNLVIQNDLITTTGQINGVTVQQHGSRHGFNDEDPITEALISDIKEINSTTKSQGTANRIARADHTHFHGNLIGGTLHQEADINTAGFMSAADKTLIDNISSNSIPQTISATTNVVGVLNSYARKDHVHPHGNLLGGHALATETTNGFMDPDDLIISDEFTWVNSMLVVSSFYSVPLQPYGLVQSSVQTITENTDVQLTWSGSSSLSSITLNNGIFTIQSEGFYIILANPLLNGGTNGYRKGYILVQGSTNYKIGETVLNYDLVLTPTLWLQAIEYLYTGDRVSTFVRAGGNTTTSINTQFAICKLF